MEMTSARLGAALRLSSEWPLASSVDELGRVAADALLQLIPGDGAGWNEIDLRGGGGLRVLANPVDYFPESEDVLGALIHENPLVAHLDRTGGEARTFSDLVGVREFHRRQIYSDVYRPFGVEDQLGAFVRIDDTAMVAVAVNRPKRTFSAADRTLLELLRRHLAVAYRTVTDRARLEALERRLDASGDAVVVLDARGAVTDLNQRARELLDTWFPDEPPRPGRFRRDGALLTVRRIDGDPPVLLLGERRLVPDYARARARGLTRRETEVLALAAEGLTSDAIAERLVLSARTVHKHLEHAYAKLGVHNRTEAARRLLEDA